MLLHCGKTTTLSTHSSEKLRLSHSMTSGIVVDDVSDHLPLFCLYDLDCLLLRKHTCIFRRKLR